MTILQYLYLYLLTVPVFFAVDMVWLGYVARGFYRARFGELLGPVNWTAAILFYLLYIVGIIVFAVAPALAKESLLRAALLGAFSGFVAYATYDLTNLATLKGWPLSVTVVDMLWGAVLTGTVASASYLLARHVVL